MTDTNTPPASHRFRWAYEAAIERSGLKPLTRLVLATIARNADARTGMIPGKYMPSAASLAARTGLSERRVRDHLKLAEDAGWIVIEQRPGRKSGIALTVPPGCAATSDVPAATPDVPAGTPDGTSAPTPDGTSDGSDLDVQSVKPQAKSSSARAREAHAKPGSGQNMTTMIISTLKFLTGKTVDEAWPPLVAAQILGRAKRPPVDPVAFVRKSLISEPDPTVFLPTYTPPSADRGWAGVLNRDAARHRQPYRNPPSEAYDVGFDGKTDAERGCTWGEWQRRQRAKREHLDEPVAFGAALQGLIGKGAG